jgi:glycine/D-amino acid oxidase-like deaminating enzyme
LTGLLLIGGGLASAALAVELAARGLAADLTAVDLHGERRASSAPLAMIHPFPGRGLAPRPLLLEVLATCAARLDHWSTIAPGAIRPARMARPLFETPDAAQLLSSFLQERAALEAANIGVDRWSKEEAAARLPWLAATANGALAYGPAWAVSLARLLPALWADLRARGVTTTAGEVVALERRGAAWVATLADGARIEAARVVLAVGAGLGAWFPALQGFGVGGELWAGAWGHGEGWPLVSGGGAYLAAGAGGELVGGATRWHGDRWASRGDAEARAELAARLGRLTGALEVARGGAIWRGERWVFQGDRHPLVGEVPGAPGLWVLGALGSRGGLWGPWCAAALAAALTEGAPIHARVALSRAGGGPARWTSPRIVAPSGQPPPADLPRSATSPTPPPAGVSTPATSPTA